MRKKSLKIRNRYMGKPNKYENFTIRITKDEINLYNMGNLENDTPIDDYTTIEAETSTEKIGFFEHLYPSVLNLTDKYGNSVTMSIEFNWYSKEEYRAVIKIDNKIRCQALIENINNTVNCDIDLFRLLIESIVSPANYIQFDIELLRYLHKTLY
jgi:hypothetical protein